MNDVKMPIVTVKEGNKITKTCVEDVHKIVNRVYSVLNKAYNNSSTIIESIEKDTENIYPEKYKGYLVVGKGISQPCLGDAFDEEIGMSIAFAKSKLNASIKKHNLLCRVYNELLYALDSIDEEIEKVDNYILYDLNTVRMYNSEYLTGIEEKLGLK